jgi:hypothetical protein
LASQAGASDEGIKGMAAALREAILSVQAKMQAKEASVAAPAVSE